jgi:hypothetical protein
MAHHASHSQAEQAGGDGRPAGDGHLMTGSAPLPPETAHKLAEGLGWFSIALGLTELLAPRALTRSLGMEGHEGLVQAYGVREIATGLGILSSDQPAPWIWGRVGGDALDLATLGAGLTPDNPQKGNIGLALTAVLGVTALDVLTAQSLSAEDSQPKQPVRDYSDRSGLPRSPQAMRGAAREAAQEAP